MILSFAASLRQDSLNKQLNQWVNRYLHHSGCVVQERLFSEYAAPLYNGDDQVIHGLPSGAQLFVDDISSAAAIIIASPEYNYSIGGPLKNLLDWASRATPNPFIKKPILLLAASPSYAKQLS